MRIMWEWSAGPHCRGITGDRQRAQSQAESYVSKGESARIEKVISQCGDTASLGVGLTGKADGRGSVTWTPFVAGAVA
jgi:hypothetical protein